MIEISRYIALSEMLIHHSGPTKAIVGSEHRRYTRQVGVMLNENVKVCAEYYIYTRPASNPQGPVGDIECTIFQTPLKHIKHNNGSNPASTTFTHVLIYNCATISSTSVQFPSQIKAIKPDVTNESPISDCLPDLHTSGDGVTPIKAKHRIALQLHPSSRPLICLHFSLKQKWKNCSQTNSKNAWKWRQMVIVWQF